MVVTRRQAKAFNMSPVAAGAASVTCEGGEDGEPANRKGQPSSVRVVENANPAKFYGKRDFPGLLAIFQDYFFIALTAGLAHKQDHWFADLIAIWVIGYFQFGTGEGLVHEASHRNLFKTASLHTILEPFIAHLHLHTLEGYRQEHKIHHVELMQPTDSTFQTYVHYGFTDPNANLFWLYWCAPVLRPIWVHRNTETGAFFLNLRAGNWRACFDGRFFLTWVLAFFLAYYLESLGLFIKYWIVPTFWTHAAFQYWSEVEEHFNTRSGARSNLVWFHNFFHHNEGYHWIHHRYPQIPFFRLPEAHAALAPLDSDVSYGMLDTYRQICKKHDPKDIWTTHPSAKKGPLRHDAKVHPSPSIAEVPISQKDLNLSVIRTGGSSLYGNLLSQEFLDGFMDYQYVSSPYVWIDRQLSPFWSWTHRTFMPSTWHPNFITLAGFFPLFCCFVTVGLYQLPSWNPSNDSPPTWLLTLSAIAMFYYQTMDCLDGLQARALRLSSPLGQLFDHGLDALVATFGLTFLVVALYGNLTRDSLLTAALFVGGYCTCFISNGFVDRHTGSKSKDCMYFSLVGVTGSEFFIMACLLLRAFSPATLDDPVNLSRFLSIDSVFALSSTVMVEQLTTAHLITIVLISFNIIGVSSSLLKFLAGPSSTLDPKDAPEEEVVKSKWLELSSFAVFFIAFVLYVYAGSYQQFTLWLIFASGSVFGHLYQNLILHDMADQPCTSFYGLVVPYFMGAVYAATQKVWSSFSVFNVVSHQSTIMTVMVISVVWMTLWVYKLFMEIATRMHIPVLRVPAGWDPALVAKINFKELSTVPFGVKLDLHPRHPTQRCLVATTDFYKGDTIGRNTCLIIPPLGHPDFKETDIFVRGHNGSIYTFHTEHASVRNSQGERHAPTFDSMMNHCCQPNTYTRELGVHATNKGMGGVSNLNQVVYEIVAERDIRSGEELTCDYDLFEWECNEGSIIENCGCGASSCRKRISGFKNLSETQQKDLLSKATTPNIQETYAVMCSNNKQAAYWE